jgi:hypothetical protein
MSAPASSYGKDPFGTGVQAGAFRRGIEVLRNLNDPELLDAYTRYVERLETILAPYELNAFAAFYQRQRRRITHQSADTAMLEVEESALRKVASDAEVHQLYDRYLSLLARRGLIDSKYEHTPLSELMPAPAPTAAE